MALLCLVTLVGGFLALRKPADDGSTAVRVDSAAAAVPGPAGAPAPQTPAALAPISLHELALAIRPRPTTSTTRPRTTTTTKKAAPTTTTPKPAAKPATTTTSPAPAPAVAPTTTALAPLTPLTTIVAAVVPPVAAVSGAVTRTDSGIASWFKAPSATCAHRTLPMGTVIKVTRISQRGVGVVQGGRPGADGGDGPADRPVTGHVREAGRQGGGPDRRTDRVVARTPV